MRISSKHRLIAGSVTGPLSVRFRRARDAIQLGGRGCQHRDTTPPPPPTRKGGANWWTCRRSTRDVLGVCDSPFCWQCPSSQSCLVSLHAASRDSKSGCNPSKACNNSWSNPPPAPGVGAGLPMASTSSCLLATTPEGVSVRAAPWALRPERGILPRWPARALESLWRLHDADGTVDEHVAAFRGPLPHAKLSWERARCR